MKITMGPKTVGPRETLRFWQYPPVALRIRDIRLTNPDPTIEIEYAQVANVILAAFTRHHPVCPPQNCVIVYVRNNSTEPITTAVEIEGDEVED